MAYFREWDRPSSAEDILSDKCISCPNRHANPDTTCDYGVVHGFAVADEDTYSIEICGRDFANVNRAPSSMLYGVVTTIFLDN